MTNLLLLQIFWCIVFLFTYELIGKFLKLSDVGDGKLKLHKNKIPAVGGVIFFISFVIFAIFIYFNLLEAKKFHEEDLFSKRGIILLIISFFFIYFLGYLDDLHNFNPNIKIFFFLIIIFLSIFQNEMLIVKNLNLSFYKKIYLGQFSLIFTVISIFIMINFFNMYDGINGQAGILILILSFYIILKFNYFFLLLFVVIPCFFFIYLNLKNKIFLGNNGSYFVSFILALLIIYLYNFSKTTYADEFFLLLIFPFLDMVRLFVTRLLSGKNPLRGDRSHFHHITEKKYGNIVANFISIILNILPVLIFNIYHNFFYAVLFFLFMYYSVFYIANQKI